MNNFIIKIIDTPLIREEYQNFLADDRSGATVAFTGTVRDFSQGKTVTGLDFEAYEPMALAEMQKLADKANEKWPIHKMVIVHVVGQKQIGEAVVYIAVTSKHRDTAFEAARFLIDELKRTVPIWKKEFYGDSSYWVNSTP